VLFGRVLYCILLCFVLVCGIRGTNWRLYTWMDGSLSSLVIGKHLVIYEKVPHMEMGENCNKNK
jgi:hypothetical protein